MSKYKKSRFTNDNKPNDFFNAHIILKYIENIREEGHFGDHKQVKDHVWELRWENGRRIYYSLIPVSQVLLLLGGNKNGQSKDINGAEKIHKEWVYD